MLRRFIWLLFLGLLISRANATQSLDSDPLFKLPAEEGEESPVPEYKVHTRENVGLKLVKKTNYAWLSVNHGKGTPEDPRKWYISILSRPPRDKFASETGIFEVFNKPGNSHRPAFPSASIQLANRPFNFDKDDPKQVLDLQLWIYPEPNPTMDKGLYVFKSTGTPGVQPLLWWGFKDSRPFTEGTPEEIEQRLETIFPGKPKDSPAGGTKNP